MTLEEFDRWMEVVKAREEQGRQMVREAAELENDVLNEAAVYGIYDNDKSMKFHGWTAKELDHVYYNSPREALAALLTKQEVKT